HSLKILTILKSAPSEEVSVAAAKIKTYLENNDIPLNIAITGECDAGKSSFLKAFRGIKDKDGGADVVDTTSVYPHPKYPNVTFSDLPGIGSTKFPADEYLKLVGFEKFDFFIIISADRFRENDVKLAKEIQKMKKNFYFVRTKIDNNIKAAQRKKDFSEERTLTQMREDCVQGLKEQGIESPQVFLVSSFHPHLYDFSLLQETFDRELPELKKHVLLLPVQNISLEINNGKKEAFLTKLKFFTLLSAAAGAVPVAAVSAAVDLSLMAAFVRGCVQGFCLDKPSLKKLAVTSGVTYMDLCAVIKSPLAGVETDKYLIMKVLITLTVTAALLAVKDRSRSIPKFGSPAAMSLSYITPYKLLMFSLNKLADDAQRVFERAVGFNTAE
uniref:IRG-type G domain-containing protein n=1 Tax=Pundamilia nyererei TaxID=303518 RepID=A0A3B4GQ43_9CICH